MTTLSRASRPSTGPTELRHSAQAWRRGEAGLGLRAAVALVLSAPLALGCAGIVAQDDAATEPRLGTTQHDAGVQPAVEPAPSRPAPAEAGQGLCETGSIAIDKVVVEADGGGTYRERLELSAPILPRVDLMYAHQGVDFPTTLAAEQQLAHDAALTYEYLVVQCQPKYPEITLQGPGDPALTAEQLAVNYDRVATCAYEDFASKAYWIPQLLLDVDLCGTELGPGWALVTEADTRALVEDDYQFLQDTLQAIDSTGFARLYFSLDVYAKATDGSLIVASLAPGVVQRLTPLDPSTLTTALQQPFSLRCLRRLRLG